MAPSSLPIPPGYTIVSISGIAAQQAHLNQQAALQHQMRGLNG